MFAYFCMVPINRLTIHTLSMTPIARKSIHLAALKQGGSRYVEVCWRFPHLKLKKVLGLWFCFFCFVSLVRNFTKLPFSCFQEDIDLISKISEMLFNGSSSFFGACLFQNRWRVSKKQKSIEIIFLKPVPICFLF